MKPIASPQQLIQVKGTNKGRKQTLDTRLCSIPLIKFCDSISCTEQVHWLPEVTTELTNAYKKRNRISNTVPYSVRDA